MNIEEAKEQYSECEAYKLEGFDFIQRLGIEKLAEVCNGIGADWQPEWSRKLTDTLFPYMRPAAFVHDARYYVGGTMIDFDGSNEEFRRNIKSYAWQKLRWWELWKYPFIAKAADEATELLRKFGLKAFNLIKLEEVGK